MHDRDKANRAAAAAKGVTARPHTEAGGAPPQGLRAIQGTAGNAAVVQMLRRSGHAWAQEQHQHGPGCGHQQPSVQRSAVHDVLRSGGRPLDEATRTDMESRLGADFADVRIHDDSAAKASAAEVGARAYTSGSHIVIGEGGGDKHTLAHELTHVIQQRQGPVAGTDHGNGLKVSDPSDRFEREAEANATRVMQRSVDRSSDSKSPTGPSSSPRASDSVQRFFITEVGNLGDVRATENGQYLIEGPDESQGHRTIWVREDATAPRHCSRTEQTQEANGWTYYAWEPANQFYADCLHTAEEIMAGRNFRLNSGVRSQVAGTGDAFGDTEEANVAAATRYARSRSPWATNHDENPHVGQALALVETDYRQGYPANESGFPYHAAAIVARDGADVITLEAWAGRQNARRRNQNGEFSVYEAGNQQLSFYAVHAQSFSAGAIAVILNPL